MNYILILIILLIVALSFFSYIILILHTEHFSCPLDPVPKTKPKNKVPNINNIILLNNSDRCNYGNEVGCLPDETAQHNLNRLDFYFKNAIEKCNDIYDEKNPQTFQITDPLFINGAQRNGYSWMVGPQKCLPRSELRKKILKINKEIIAKNDKDKINKAKQLLECRNANKEGLLNIKNDNLSWNEDYIRCMRGKLDLNKRRELAKLCVKANDLNYIKINNNGVKDDNFMNCISGKLNIESKLKLAEKCEQAVTKDILIKRNKKSSEIHKDFQDCLDGILDIDGLLNRSDLCYEAVDKNIIKKKYKTGFGLNSKSKLTENWNNCLKGKLSKKKINNLIKNKLNRRQLLCEKALTSNLLDKDTTNYIRCINGQSFDTKHVPQTPHEIKERKIEFDLEDLDVYGFKNKSEKCDPSKKVYQYSKNILPIFWFDLVEFKWKTFYL